MVVPVAAQDQQPRHLENEEDLLIDLNDDNSQPPADAVAVAVDQTARQIRETELYLYLQEPALSLYVNPYNFAEGHDKSGGKQREIRFQFYSQRLLCIPATSAPTERLFSVVGLI